jgi:hypothetical protein
MEYDFANYLQTADPGQRYLIEKLSGGYINLTVRATKESSNLEHRSRFGHESIILKYAPPYIASIGESAPFSQSRQVS